MTPMNEIVSNQRHFFKAGGTRDVVKRLAVLARLEAYMIANQEALLVALEKDLGKPRLESFLSEYYFLLEEIRLIQKSLKQWLKPKKVKSPIYFQPCKSEVVLSPFGVVLIVSPWNYPIQLALSPMISAIAAGNTVVLKPSEHSSASEAFLQKLVTECFPPELVSVVTGGVEVAQQLLELRYDFIFYTGSTAVGRVVAAAAAKHLTPTVLELGGKCPCIVDRSVDVTMAAQRILSGKFFNGGQTCFAPDFVAVHQDVKEEFIRACEQVFEDVPWSEEMAHIINSHHYDRLSELLADSGSREISQGADDSSRLFLAPRVLPDAEWEDSLMKEEVFGPILPVVSFEKTETLVETLQAYSSPLALYLFSDNQEWLEEVSSSVASGGLCINDTMKQGTNLHLPFGGVGDSGYGRYRGKEGVLAMSYQRGVVRRSVRAPNSMNLLPPYEKTYGWLKKFMK